MTRRPALAVLVGAAGLVAASLSAAQAATPAPDAASELVLAMPPSAPDRTEVTVDVQWRSSDGQAGITGPATLEFMRRGVATWEDVLTVPVKEGVGRARLTPRDDGIYRVSSAGGAGLLPTASALTTFDNVPTKDVRLVIGQYNLPGADKLAKPVTRARKAAASINAGDLDAVTLNELVGPGKDSTSNAPSEFARIVLKVLGSKWRIVTPTTQHNENYIVYRPDRLAVIQQYPDRIVPAVRDPSTGTVVKTTGRHVTPVLFKDLGSNQPVLVGATHLVNGNRPGAREQAFSVGASMSALSSGYPVVVGGDMNTSGRLEGFTAQGLKDARVSTSRRTDPLYATYVTYSSRKPRKDLSTIIDQIYVPSTWKVDRWVTKLPVKRGLFTVPRASDHLLVWSVLTGPPA